MCSTHTIHLTGVVHGMVGVVTVVVTSCLRVGIVHVGSVITKADPAKPR